MLRNRSLFSASRVRLAGVLALAIGLVSASPLFAIGTYSEGWAFVTLKKFEQRGIFIDSWEGDVALAHFDSGEACDEAANQCYTPTERILAISVRPETHEAVDVMRNNIGRQILIRYRTHRIEALALDSDIEILEAKLPETRSEARVAERKVVDRSGGRRNFSVRGRILQMERRGTAVKTYEGLYLDEQNNKVHPFSVTDGDMAEHIYAVMQQGGSYFIGVSVAYVTGLRESDYDIFEINFNEAAGGAN